MRKKHEQTDNSSEINELIEQMQKISERVNQLKRQ